MSSCEKCLHYEVCDRSSHMIWNEIYKKECPDFMGWIPVSERLPEIGDICFVVVKYKYDFEKEYTYDTDAAIYCSADGYIDDCWDTFNDWNEGQQHIHVTHWMPLPEPPKEEK